MVAAAPPTEHVVCDRMLTIEHELQHADPEVAAQLIAFCRRRLDATEASVIARQLDNGTTSQQVEDRLRRDGKTSRREAKRRASRAKAVNANPDIATRLRNGTMSTEQADIIADAAADTDGAAACDETLLNDVSSVPPEQGKKKADTFVTKTKTNDQIETEHERARRNRTVYRKRRRDGLHELVIQGDKHSIDQIEARLDEQAEHEYRQDGGRDVPRAQHPRTRNQRRFDALHALTTQAPSGDDAAANAVAKVGRRSTIFVTATIDQLTGVDPSVVTSCDGARLPRSIIECLACDADFIGQIYDQNGNVLWQGRAVRFATPAQVRALIARDGGCVSCGAHHSRCVAHHRLPFEAAIAGATDIDNLVLLCESCHHHVHNAHLTLFRDAHGDWKTRAATAEEIAPAGGPPAKRRPNRHSTRSGGPRNRGDREPPGDKPHFFERRRQLYEEHRIDSLF